ncbi:MAG: DUF3307 domain-containing protein [Elusimicrobia bacterium]|nr:DUF3307 domain-containing protein [Elusimicrobiota bacterium]
MEILWRLLFGHLLADFTFQTDFINRWKRRSFWGVLVHSLMHPAFYLVLCRPFLGDIWVAGPWLRLNGWECLAIVFATHLLEDWWRVHAIRAYGMPDNTLFFLWDQVIHYAVIFAVVPMAAADAASTGFFPEKWPVLGCLFILTTHACTVLVYFLEKDLHGAEFPGFDEKYLAMAERLVLALCLLFPSPAGAAALAAVWLIVMLFLRRGGLFDLTAFAFYLGSGLSLLCGLAARALYYS